MKKGRVSKMDAKRGKILIPMVFMLAWAWLTFHDCSTAVADYSFYLDRFEVSGQVNASDEFDDGVVDPWVIYDPTVEESDGFVSFSNPGTIEDGVLDGVNYVAEMSFIGTGYESPFVVENGGGNFTGISRWSPIVPEANQWYEMEVSYEVQQEPHISIDISVGVANWDSEFAAIMGIEPGLGISFYRSTDSLLWRHIPINEADLTSADAILLSLDFYDDTDEFRAGFSLDDGDTYQYFSDLIGWGQETPGHYEWYFSGQTIELQGPTDSLDIDMLGISAAKQFRDGEPQGDFPWSLDITVWLADPDNLHHIDVTKPDGSVPFVTLYEEAGSPGLWGCSLDDDYATLTALHDVYKEGPYKFEFRTIDNLLIRSLDIDYTDLPDEPDEPVEFVHPSENGQTGISVNPTFEWSLGEGAGDALMMAIDNDETVYFEAPVPIGSTTWTPGPLLEEHQYELDVLVINVKDWVGPGFPTMTDSTGDTFSYAYTTEYLNEIAFTTQSSAGPVEPIEEVLDLVDEAVDAGTLTGDGPGKSADNRLNALINMLEEAQGLIEAGLYEEACDQLWAAYRKCDGDRQPPDFVAGEAADDLADMILLTMDELGCE